MNASYEKLYLELRETEQELINGLMRREQRDWLWTILEAELNDVRSALEKMQNGRYGECELSGELIPNNFLEMIPTLKSEKDIEHIAYFFKKSCENTF